ncbi:hypothetical protein [Asaia sp. VD9]|uniref:hypothetical protein n=1 Tax=Asaia sp. VD9 TaxID=3081235 RepID=UPI003016840F
MTHEQKPESAEFRTTEEHALALRHIIDETRVPDRLPVALAHVRAAEARGAAEQRRKDAEGAEPVGYVRPDMMEFFRQSKALFTSASIIPKRDETHTEALYTRPANVAALEAQVKELEEENKVWSSAVNNALTWLENSRKVEARVELKSALRRIAAIREGGEHG